MLVTLDLGNRPVAAKWLANKPRLRARFKRKHAPSDSRREKLRGSADPERRIFEHPPRRRYLRTFVTWFAANRHRFLLPLRISRVSSWQIALSISCFGGFINAGVLRLRGQPDWLLISVSVTWQGEVIDELLDLDLSTCRVAHGYVCGTCIPEYAETYPTREALWIGHTFEAFLNFVNDTLAAAEFLNIYLSEGASWASLDATPDTDYARCIASVARDGSMLTRPCVETPVLADENG